METEKQDYDAEWESVSRKDGLLYSVISCVMAR